MKFEYKLTAEDFLTYQLYSASQSPAIQKKRRNTRFLVPLLYIVLGGYSYIDGKSLIVGGSFIGVAFIWYFLYPFYSAWRYKRHFQRQIDTYYKDRVNINSELTIEKNRLIAKDETAESKVKVEELDSLIEINDYFFIQLKTGIALVLPLKVVQDKTGLIKQFENMNVPYKSEKNWIWK